MTDLELLHSLVAKPCTLKANSDEELLNVFSLVGSVCAKLARNDSEPELIRNKYGRIDCAHSYALRAEGLDFDMFARLSKLLVSNEIREEIRKKISIDPQEEMSAPGSLYSCNRYHNINMSGCG